MMAAPCSAALAALFGTCVWAGVAAPDLAVTAISDPVRLGTVDGITAYAVGTTLCNLGSSAAAWSSDTADHGVVALDLYRIDGDGVTHIGTSWARHASGLPPVAACGACPTGPADTIPPGCAAVCPPSIAALAVLFGPREQVDPFTGTFPYPWQDGVPPPPAVIGRHLQVHAAALDPIDHADALLVLQVQVIAAGDAVAANNVTTCEVVVSGRGTGFDLVVVGGTAVGATVLDQWLTHDAGVVLGTVDVPGDGRLQIGTRVTPMDGGQWHYVTAVLNLTSARAVQALELSVPGVPLGPAVHSHLPMHSGAAVTPTPWSVTLGAGVLSAATALFADAPTAPAIRWGSLHRLSYTAPAPPTLRPLVLRLFRPGIPSHVTTTVPGPEQLSGAAALAVSGSAVVDAGTTTAFAAHATLVTGATADVSLQASWSLDPPELGIISPTGVFTAATPVGDRAGRVIADYTDGLSAVTAQRAIVVRDTARVVLALQSTVDPGALTAGQPFAVDVRAASTVRPIEDVRLLQFDLSLSGGVTLNDWTWTLPVIDPGNYLTFTPGAMHHAVYVATQGDSDTTVTLDGTPRTVATLTATFETAGRISVRGPAPAPSVDIGARVLAGFQTVRDYRIGCGSLVGGVLATGALADRVVIDSIPAHHAIDARQPTPPDDPGLRLGWTQLELFFDAAVDDLTAADFAIYTTAGPAPPLTTIEVVDNAALLTLATPPAPGTWTAVEHLPSGTGFRVGTLPGDVDGDARTASLDLLALIDALNGTVDRPLYAIDIDHSAVATPGDILRWIDLANGAGVFDAWLDADLPATPH